MRYTVVTQPITYYFFIYYTYASYISKTSLTFCYYPMAVFRLSGVCAFTPFSLWTMGLSMQLYSHPLFFPLAFYSELQIDRFVSQILWAVRSSIWRHPTAVRVVVLCLASRRSKARRLWLLITYYYLLPITYHYLLPIITYYLLPILLSIYYACRPEIRKRSLTC